LNNRRRILFLVTEDGYFCSHRLPIAREAKRKGFDVLVATRVRNHGKQIEREGFKLIPIGMSRTGMNPLKELATLWELVRLYKTAKPDIVHHVAMKPVLYGSLAAWISKVPYVVNALAGLGYVFTSNQWKAVLLRKMTSKAFRILLNRPNSRVILQNPDNRNLMVRLRILNLKSTVLIRSSGVDTQSFFPTPEPPGITTVLLASRMLWDKGIGEFVEAARLIRDKGIDARFILAGDTDPENPAAVPPYQLEAWNRGGVVEWWGRRENMAEVFAQAHIVCLPSYGEGVPKVLIEAAASGLPIVTTDVPGCRETVLHGKNGLLVPVRSAIELAAALERLIRDPVLRREMGAHGRELAVSEFSIEKVVNQTLALYQELAA